MAKKNRKKPDDMKEKAIQLYGINGSITRTAEELGVAKSTVHRWLNSDECSEIVKQVRTENKIEFAEKAGEIINKGLELLDRRINTALDHEIELEAILDEICSDNDMKPATKRAFIKKIGAMQVQKISEISTAVGTLFDKRALARGESTANNQITIKLEGDLEELAK